MRKSYQQFCQLGYSCLDIAELVDKHDNEPACLCPDAPSAPQYNLALLVIAVLQLVLSLKGECTIFDVEHMSCSFEF